MNSTAVLSNPCAFSGMPSAAPSTSAAFVRREQALVAERMDALQRADKAKHALEQIRNNRCGASCLRDLARTVALLLIVFGLPALMLVAAQNLPKGTVLAVGMALIWAGWMGMSLVVRRYFFERA